MKKWLGIGLLVGLFFLTGCTKLPQDQFADGLTVQKDMNAGDFSVTIDTFEFAGEDSQNSQESMIAGMIFSQLAGTKITGNFVEDPKSKNIRLDASLSSGEIDVPLNLLIDGKSHDTYLSAEIVEAMSNLFAFDTFGTSDTFASDTFDSSETPDTTGKDKYIRLSPDEMSDLDTDQLLNNSLFSSETLAEYVKTLDSESFKRDGDTITHTFTKQELLDFVDYAKKQKADTSEITQWEDLLKDSERIDLTVSVNAKKQNQKVVMNMTQSGELPLAIGITFTISGKQSDEKVQLPASENVVDQQEFFDSYQEDSFWDDSYYGDDPLSDEDWTNYTLTDEEFDQLLEMVATDLQGMTDEEIVDFLLIYEDLLTEEQYQRLAEALQVSQNL